MRKLMAIAILAGVASLAPISAHATLEIQGFIKYPTRYPDTATLDVSRGFPGVGRRLWLATDGLTGGAVSTNGTVAYVIEVSQETWGQEFVVGNVQDSTGEADLDIYFYDDFGKTVDTDNIDADTAPTTSIDGEFGTVAAGGEIGIVPEGATRAIVFTGNGMDSTFTYTVG